VPVVLGRIFGLIIGFIAAVFLVTLAVANRHPVKLILDPFNPENPVLSADLPFYAYLFAMLIGGVILGGFSTWIGQSKWRRTAYLRTQEAIRARAEAERLTREREAAVAAGQMSGHATIRPGGRQLAIAGGSAARAR
jgi:Mn2+/Fe2+ NRAMP family transporter